MKILLTNDDGLDSPALLPTLTMLATLGDVECVIPRYQQSWTSKANTRRSSKISKEVYQVADFEVITLDALPADCANYGIYRGQIPDLVVSGANIGHNVGLSAMFSSGTVGAALEGMFEGIPSISISVPYTANSELIPEPFAQAIEGIDQFLKVYLKTRPSNVGLAMLNLPYGKRFKRLQGTVPAQFHYGKLFEDSGDYLRPVAYPQLGYPDHSTAISDTDVWTRYNFIGSVSMMQWDGQIVTSSKVQKWLETHELNELRP